MRQTIHEDPHEFDVWDTDSRARCFVHITNSLVWRQITGKNPPTVPPTAKEYNNCGLPWFELYEQEAKALKGSSVLADLKSVAQMGQKKGDVPLPENQSLKPKKVIGLSKDRVRDGDF
jgi:hypothetical protein